MCIICTLAVNSMVNARRSYWRAFFFLLTVKIYAASSVADSRVSTGTVHPLASLT